MYLSLNGVQVLWEQATAKIPFHEIQETSIVSRTIVEGGRPKIPEDSPTQYADVMKRCWEQGKDIVWFGDTFTDPTKRPTFEELVPVFQQLVGVCLSTLSSKDIHGPQLEIKTTV